MSTGLSHPAIRNAGWLFADRALRVLIGLSVSLWVARYLGPAAFGQLAYALALTAFFQAVAGLGLDAIVVREIAHDSSQAPEVLGTAGVLRLSGGVACWAAAVATVAASRPGDVHALQLVAIVAASLLFQPAEVVDLWFQSQSESRRTVLAKLVSTLAANALRVGLILRGAPLLAFAWVTLAEVVISAVALWVSYRRHVAGARWQASWARAAQLLGESWPLMLGAASVIVYMRATQVILKELGGDRALGLYSGVLPLAEGWNYIPMIACVSLAPALTRAKAVSEARYRAFLQAIFAALFWIALALAAVLALGAGPIVGLLLGADYAPAVPVLRISAFTLIPVFLGVAQGLWVINERRGRARLFQTLSGAVVCITLALALVPPLGAVGAAWAMLLAYLTSAILSNVLIAPEILTMQLRACLPSSLRAFIRRDAEP